MPAPTQPDPAEGKRDDSAPLDKANQGRSAETPAEGADDTPAEQPGSARG